MADTERHYTELFVMYRNGNPFHIHHNRAVFERWMNDKPWLYPPDQCEIAQFVPADAIASLQRELAEMKDAREHAEAERDALDKSHKELGKQLAEMQERAMELQRETDATKDNWDCAEDECAELSAALAAERDAASMRHWKATDDLTAERNEIGRLKLALEEAMAERDGWRYETLELRAKGERLETALRRIGGINDNPARYIPEINDVIQAAMADAPALCLRCWGVGKINERNIVEDCPDCAPAPSPQPRWSEASGTEPIWPSPPAASPVQPDKWKEVPIVPTEAMLEAALDISGARIAPYEAPRESGVPVECDISDEDARRLNDGLKAEYADLWRAMVAAAPATAPPVQSGRDDELEREIAQVIADHVTVGYTLRPDGLVDPDTIFVTAHAAAHVVRHKFVTTRERA